MLFCCLLSPYPINLKCLYHSFISKYDINLFVLPFSYLFGFWCAKGPSPRAWIFAADRERLVERQMFEERGADSLRQPSSFMTRKEGSFFFLFLWRRQQEMLSSPPCSVFWFLSPLTFETCYSGSDRQFFLLPTHPQPISTRSGTRQLTRFIPLSGTK